ncbi:ergothioneine biosynthesis protein EgtC [Streptomyces sp. TR06-5]|uniref:ergothioneine biosynthesis protein EgtC n=1 Tax=unclassified Streptomyces TaxID=2593676 RepID=UPI0039A01863
MCRHLAYLGPPLALGTLLRSPSHSLHRQSWAPRRQRHGTVNADGFGVGWYTPEDPVPARYRRARPVWADPFFDDLCRTVRSHAVLAAVRDITEGCVADESAVAPYTAGRWLFSHNGSLTGWPRSVSGPAAALPAEALLSLEARCDSALAWAMVQQRLGEDGGPGEALTAVTLELGRAAPGSRLNFLLCDDRTLAATAWGDELWYLHRGGEALVVASEPYDDDPLWTAVPDRHLLTGDPASVRLTPLDARPAAPATPSSVPLDETARPHSEEHAL